MCAQKIVLGDTVDFITGETIVDTLDERARQKIARFLVEEKGYLKDEIEVKRHFALDVDGKRGAINVDFLLSLAGKVFMIIIFGPGSLVSRERPAVAAARLIEPYVIPFAVVTNGETAEVLETASGKTISEGLEGIPSREEALTESQKITYDILPEERRDRERRILFAFEVLAERECNESTCSLR